MADNPQTINVTGAMVAVLLVAMLGGAIGALLMRSVPDANMNVLLVLLGALATNVTNVVQFFFGNSAANRQKDATIGTLANTAQATQAAATPVATVTTPEVKVPLKAGETASVTASPTPSTLPK